MQAPRLKSPITIYELQEAFSALEIDPRTALKDPIIAMRRAATADLDLANRFLRAVLLPGQNVDLARYEDEDEARLFVAAVLARVLIRARKSCAALHVSHDVEPVAM